MPAHQQPEEGRRRPEWSRRDLSLSYPEALSLHAMARNKRRKKERLLAKSTFVPEPGHAHAGEISLRKARFMEDRLMAFIETYPEYNPAEWADDDDG